MHTNDLSSNTTLICICNYHLKWLWVIYWQCYKTNRFFFKLRERVTLFSSCNSLQGYLIKPCFSHGLLTLSYHIKDFDKFSLNVILKRSHCLTESPISIGKRIPELQSKISIIKHLRVIICIQVITPFFKTVSFTLQTYWFSLIFLYYILYFLYFRKFKSMSQHSVCLWNENKTYNCHFLLLFIMKL